MESGGKPALGEPSSYDWDDTELIRLYDEGMEQVKNKIRGNTKASTKFGGNKSEKKCHGNKSSVELTVGDFCQAVFSEDGLRYEAVIKTIQDDNTCVVEFVGYGNEETVPMGDLTHSKGPGARHEQIEQAEHADRDWKVGDYCWAIYSEDNQWYEGKILEIIDDETVTVKFIGYDNKEEVPTYNLKPFHHRSTKSGEKSHRDSSVDNYSEENCSLSSQYSSMTESCSSYVSDGDYKRLIPRSQRVHADESFVSPRSHNRHHSSRRCPPAGPSNSYIARRAPSLPPFPVNDDDDTLSSLLLSWYMAGYHTGYHMGVRSRSRH